MDRFSKISEKLAVEMTSLTNNSKWLFVLLLSGVVRNRFTNEPKIKISELSYQNFKMFEIARKNFDRGIKELIRKKYIRVSGKQRTKTCELLKW